LIKSFFNFNKKITEMKKIKLFILLLIVGSSALMAQKFQTTFRSVGNTVTIYLRPDATGLISFSDIEFFIRYTSSQTLTFSNFQPNTVDFPLIVFNDNILTPIEREVGFKSIKVGFIPGGVSPLVGVSTTTTNYVSGTEYKFCSFQVSGMTASATLQIVHEEGFDPYYVSITKENPTEDAAPASPLNYFYIQSLFGGSTISSSNSGGKTFYFLELNSIVLPLSLLDFTAKADKQTAHLKWLTANERTASYFDIEKSVDSKNWTRVGSQKAGNTEGYAFTDPQAFDKTNAPYYRLKMMENDGTFSYSMIRQVKIDKVRSIKVYPNPAKDALYIEGIETKNDWQIKLLNNVGQVVATHKGMGASSIEITTQDFNSGMYIVEFQSDETRWTKKVVIQH
jgi:hypothetical protein